MSSSCSKARGIDDLSLVKAAAWAKWCEEFDLSRNYKKVHQEPSSRYKLQVISTKQVHQELSQYSFSPNVFVPIVQLNSTTTSNNNNNNSSSSISLLDKYEIERITSQLDEYIESSKEKINKSSEKKINICKGFLLFRYYKMMMMKMCVTSSYDDVVVVERRVFSNPQLPEKSPAVKFATCRPQRKHVSSRGSVKETDSRF